MEKIMTKQIKETAANLAEYFKLRGIDEIEDDETFMEEEHETMVDYFNEREFFLSDDDADTLAARGLTEDFELSKRNWKEWREDDDYYNRNSEEVTGS